MSKGRKEETELLAEFLDLALPPAYEQLLCTEGATDQLGRPILGLPLDPGPDSAWGATEMLRLLLPDLFGQRPLIALQIFDAEVVALDVANGGDRVVRFNLESLEEQIVAESLDDFARVSPEQAQTAAEIENTLGVKFPPELVAFFDDEVPAALYDLAYRPMKGNLGPPSVLWAYERMAGGAQAPDRALVPIIPVDDRSFACVICQVNGQALPSDFGRVVRWHLDDVPLRAQRVLLDLTLPQYVSSVVAQLESRAAGLAKIDQITLDYEASHGSFAGAQTSSKSSLRLPKFFELKPVRLAVQNVIVGLAAFHHDSEFDGLAVYAFQVCEAPHLNALEGCRGLLGMMLAEAFQSGGTMEVRFDQHPEGRIPAAIRQLARVHGFALDDTAKGLLPDESRRLFEIVCEMPQQLALRAGELVESGNSTIERLCFVQLTGIWHGLDLDFLLATTHRAGSILRGEADVFDRRASQAEFEVCRAAVMLGVLYARITNKDQQTGDERVAVVEDDRAQVSWQVTGEYGAVLFEAQTPLTFPWLRPTAAESFERLMVLPRIAPEEDDLKTAGQLAEEHHCLVAFLVPADYPDVGRLSNEGRLVMVCPEMVSDLDRSISLRLLSCRVGRA